MKDVLDIVREYLITNGLDGLVAEGGECACDLKDLEPCENLDGSCQPGHKAPCDCGDHDYHIVSGPRPEGGA